MGGFPFSGGRVPRKQQLLSFNLQWNTTSVQTPVEENWIFSQTPNRPMANCIESKETDQLKIDSAYRKKQVKVSNITNVQNLLTLLLAYAYCLDISLQIGQDKMYIHLCYIFPYLADHNIEIDNHSFTYEFSPDNPWLLSACSGSLEVINLLLTNLQTDRPAHQFLQPAVREAQDHYLLLC